MGTRHILAGLTVALMGSAAQATVIYSLEGHGVYNTQVAGAHTINFNDGSCGRATRRAPQVARSLAAASPVNMRRRTAFSTPTLP